jgi:aerotaxis receptor
LLLLSRRASAASQRLGEIIQAIDSISFQTNILALNAAVEAARAGEVRALGGKTTDAAREKAVGQLYSVMQGNVATVQQLSSATQTLHRQAEEVTAAVRIFRLPHADAFRP